jgi:hypothetical protein
VPPKPGQAGKGRETQLKRAALVLAAAVLSVNIFTGAPLFALWVGARTVPESGSAPVTMGAIFVVVIVLAVVVFVLTALLFRIHATYDELTERPLGQRRTSPWLRSMRGEREELRRKREGTSAVEIVVMLSVAVAIVAFEIWFFFFAHYALPGVNR